MIRRPMEKSVGQFEHGTGRLTIYVVRQLACVQRKACWIVGANSSCRCEGWKNWGKGGGDTFGFGCRCPSTDVHFQPKPANVVMVN